MSDADTVQVIKYRLVGHHGDAALHRAEVGFRRLEPLTVDTCVLMGLIALHVDRDASIVVYLKVAVRRLYASAA